MLRYATGALLFGLIWASKASDHTPVWCEIE